jgi:hypothetical protein
VAKGGVLVSLDLMGAANSRPEEFGLKEESSEDQDQEERKEDLKETSD